MYPLPPPDILFALVKSVCAKRADLRVIVTSATLNAHKFSAYFNDCPIIRIPGRMYPVDIYHSKTRHEMTPTGPASRAYVTAAVDLALKIHKEQGSGHILMFLTGQEDIEHACSELRRREKEEALALTLALGQKENSKCAVGEVFKIKGQKSCEKK